MLIEAGIVVVAYFWGAVPTSYLAGRYLKGIDLRKFGSGNVGASNLSTQAGVWTALAVGTFDSLAKGALPIALLKALDYDLGLQALVGVVVVIGHNWSPYLKFTGGRGVATSIGVVAGHALWWEAIVGFSLIGIVGRLLTKDSAFWTLIGMLALPLMNAALGRPQEIVYMSVGIAVVLMAKRLTANWERPSDGYPLAKVLMCRLLWDRDVPRQDEWTGRQPST